MLINFVLSNNKKTVLEIVNADVDQLRIICIEYEGLYTEEEEYMGSKLGSK